MRPPAATMRATASGASGVTANRVALPTGTREGDSFMFESGASPQPNINAEPNSDCSSLICRAERSPAVAALK